jgi:hypothetical protein
MVIAVSFPNVLAFAAKVVSPSPETPAPTKPPAGQGNGAAKNDAVKKHARGNGGHAPHQAAARHDQTLLALMRANPSASVTEIIRLNGRPRNSTVASLERLEKAGLVEHSARGKWTVVDPDLAEAPTPKPAGWTAPLSAKRVARHAADGQVRDEMTLA